MNHKYAKDKLELLLRDVGNYTADEFRRQMARITSGATGQDTPDDCHTIAAERDSYHEAERVWEITMMQAVGEDGPGDVVKAIDAIKAERDNAWQELREIREAIGANPEESTADEVRRVVAQAETLRLKAADRDKLKDELIDRMKLLDMVMAQLVAVKESGGTGQSPCAKFCESVALRKDFSQLREHADRMKVGRDAALARVKLLHSAFNELVGNAYTEPDAYGNILVQQCDFNAVHKVFEATPAQCLRDIQAEAVMNFAEIIRGAYLSGFSPAALTVYDAYQAARNHVFSNYETETAIWNDADSDKAKAGLEEMSAHAGRAGFIACIKLAYELQHPPGTTHADQYAASVKAGKS